MSSNELLHVTDEFLEQNSKNAKIKKHAKKGGPYSKNDKNKRRDEVYRLHFEYGYSARKISELMNVNRNTINGDVDYWYSKMFKNVNFFNLELQVIVILERMEIQLTRLREQLDKVKTSSERLARERLIYDINSKIIHTYQKLHGSVFRNYKREVQSYNDFKEKNNYSERVISLFDTI